MPLLSDLLYDLRSVIKILLENRAEVEVKDKNGWMLLH